MTIPSGAEQLKRQFEAYAIGRVEALRVNLQFFLEEMNAIPESMAPLQFAKVAYDAEELLKTIMGALSRAPGTGVTVIEAAHPIEVTDEMVEAGIEAMVWEGSTVSTEEMPSVIREVIEGALAVNKQTIAVM